MKAPFLRESPQGVLLAVKLQPRASRDQIQGVHGDELKISVTAPPVDSAANRALLEFLRESLDCRSSEIELVRGHASRHKVILLRGFTMAEAAARLEKAQA